MDGMELLRMDHVSPKIGVVEVFGLIGSGIPILQCLRRIVPLLSGDSKKIRSRRSTLELLVSRLEAMDQTYAISKCFSKLPDAVRTSLSELEEIAGGLEKRVGSGSLQRVLIWLKEGEFDKQIDKLRTGLDDIEKVLKLDHRTSNYQAGALTHSHGQMLPVPAPAPQAAFIINPQACHVTIVVNNGQAASQVAAVAYPAPALVGYQAPALIGYQAPPPIGYPPQYTRSGYPTLAASG